VVTPQTRVNGLGADPIAPSYVGDVRPVVQDLEHGRILLFHEIQLRQHVDGRLHLGRRPM
jgi:hypothetical protein